MLEQEMVQAHTLRGWGLRVPQGKKPARLVPEQTGRVTSWWSAAQIEDAGRQPGVLEEVVPMLRQVRRRVPERHIWVELPTRLNPITAEVYAAYLAEQGYEDAAGCMRQVSALLRRKSMPNRRSSESETNSNGSQPRKSGVLRSDERKLKRKGERIGMSAR